MGGGITALDFTEQVREGGLKMTNFSGPKRNLEKILLNKVPLTKKCHTTIHHERRNVTGPKVTEAKF